MCLGTQTIESSIVPGQLGYWSVATIYAAFAVGALILSSGVVSKISPKVCIVTVLNLKICSGQQ